jgi:hypothetical protein
MCGQQRVSIRARPFKAGNYPDRSLARFRRVRMSVIGGKADVPGTAAKSPLIARSGHSSAPWSKIRPSDGCGRDAVPLAVERQYDFPEFGDQSGKSRIIVAPETSTKA